MHTSLICLRNPQKSLSPMSVCGFCKFLIHINYMHFHSRFYIGIWVLYNWHLSQTLNVDKLVHEKIVRNNFSRKPSWMKVSLKDETNKLLNEHIAKVCNAEDNVKGHFYDLHPCKSHYVPPAAFKFDPVKFVESSLQKPSIAWWKGVSILISIRIREL